MQNRYLYTVRHRNDFSGDVDVDCWMECPPQPTHVAATAALNKMSGKKVIPNAAAKEIGAAIFSMEMRIRMNADFYPHVLLVKVDDYELDRDLMENLLQTKRREGTLSEFLESSKL